jgi:hypothetical protein
MLLLYEIGPWHTAADGGSCLLRNGEIKNPTIDFFVLQLVKPVNYTVKNLQGKKVLQEKTMVLQEKTIGSPTKGTGYKYNQTGSCSV